MARHEPMCNVTTHVPGELHSQQLTRKNEEIDVLTAERDAYLAELNRAHPELDNADLLRSLAQALRTGEEASVATAASVPTDADSGRSKPGSRPPSGGNRHAAGALRQLVVRVSRALDSFAARQENEWQPHRIDFDNRPRDRCWTRSCGNYSRWFRDECPGCGKAATNTATNGEENSELHASAGSA